MNAMVSRHQAPRPHGRGREARPLDGRIKTRNMRGDEVEMRLSTLPTAFGEKMVMRIFDPDTAVKDLDALGFAQHDAQRWQQLVTRPHGIVSGGPDRPAREDHDAVSRRPARRDGRSEREHGRRPDRNDRAVLQPDAGAVGSSTSASPKVLACADAAGPGHHHGRRNPATSQPPTWRPGCADRPPGASARCTPTMRRARSRG